MSSPEQAKPDTSGQPVSASERPASAEAVELVGTSIGKYTVVRKLGEGGMGAVFEARHSEIGQRAAVKVLHPHLSADPKFVQRFVDEARMISMVGHPGLVKIYDFNQTSDGAQCIVMEFLEGESLWTSFTRRKGASSVPGLPIPEVVQLVRQVASALAAVHERSIIHRDLKPDNIMLVKDPETISGKRAKILDFGIAKFDQTSEVGRQTTAGVVLGTPTYMAPEQIEGLPNPTDRIDVYALGVILFELLAGVPPFEADNANGVMSKHLVKPPPPLPEHVPAALQDLVRVTLAKTASERPSMLQLVERLDALSDPSKPATGGTPSPPKRAAWSWLRKGLFIGVGVTLAIGVALLDSPFSLWPRKPPMTLMPSPAVSPPLPEPPRPSIAPPSLPKAEVPEPSPAPTTATIPARKKPASKSKIKSSPPAEESARFNDLPRAPIGEP